MSLYSPTLLIAMIAAAVAVLAAGASLTGYHRERTGRAARMGGAVSMVLAGAALGAHLMRDHRPGTEAGLGIAAFFAAHPAPLLTMLIGALCLCAGTGRHSSRAQ